MAPKTDKEKALSCGTSGTVFMSGVRDRDVVIELGKLKIERGSTWSVWHAWVVIINKRTCYESEWKGGTLSSPLTGEQMMEKAHQQSA